MNASATLGLLQAARSAGVGRFVYVSSSEVYGTARVAPITEEHPTLPMTVYGASKLAGEGLIQAYCTGFGFQEMIGRFGIERRVHTSGERKSMLDPFRPERKEDVERLERLQAEIHENFKDWVRERRAGRLKGEEATLFSGEFWTGQRALQLGLVDGLGELRSVLQQRYGAKVHLPLIAPKRSFLSRFGIGSQLENIGPSTVAALEDRLLWQRFGL